MRRTVKENLINISNTSSQFSLTHKTPPITEKISIDTQGNRVRPDAVGIELRSLIGTLFFVSHGVDVPARDLTMGRAMETLDKSGRPFDWSLVVGDLFNIRSQPEKPDNAQVAIKYRGSWFYIDDSDLNSKYSFLLLEQLTALLGGKTEKTGPILTLPASAP